MSEMPMIEPITAGTALVGGRYIVTSKGDIFGIDKSGSIHKITPRVHNHGYLRFTFCDGNLHRDIYIHRIVALAFIPNPNGYGEVNHIDGNKKNNDVSNLEWCNRQMNNLHAFKTGLRQYEELKEMARRPCPKQRKLSIEDIRRIRGEENSISNTRLASKYGINRDSIRKIKTHETYKEVV